MGVSSAAASILGLIAALALASGARADDPAKCVLAKAGELPVKFENNRPLVPVSINGRDSWFLIDTGATTTLMFGGAAKSLGLTVAEESDEVEFYGVGGKQAGMVVRLTEFGLAGMKVKNQRLFVIGHNGSIDEAGILGRDFLGHYDLEFDLASKAVRLWQPKNCGDRPLAYWTDSPQQASTEQFTTQDAYRMKILVNGAPIDSEMDSGATSSVITPHGAYLAKLPKEDLKAGDSYEHGIGDAPVSFQIGTFDSVAIGTEEIKHARLQVADLFGRDVEVRTGSRIARAIDPNEVSMLLGADFLRSHRVFLVNSQHTMYFTYSGGPVFQVIGEAVKPEASTKAAKSASPPKQK